MSDSLSFSFEKLRFILCNIWVFYRRLLLFSLELPYFLMLCLLFPIVNFRVTAFPRLLPYVFCCWLQGYRDSSSMSRCPRTSWRTRSVSLVSSPPSESASLIIATWYKKVFDWDAYRPPQWPPRRGGLYTLPSGIPYTPWVYPTPYHLPERTWYHYTLPQKGPGTRVGVGKNTLKLM